MMLHLAIAMRREHLPEKLDILMQSEELG